MHQENKFNLSVVIPVFNEEKYLSKLFKSLLKYFNKKNIQIIIVDDGSTDSSTKIINEFEKIRNIILN